MLVVGIGIVAVGVLAFRWVIDYFFGSGVKDTPPIFFDDPNAPKSVQPIEENKERRAAVLKQAFSPEKIPKDLDAIVIGSGIGSLSVAGLLAKVGKTVLVLEQHDRAGGCCHTFVEKGYEFDTGIHYIGEMRPNAKNRILMDILTDGQLEWDQLDDVYDRVVIGYGDEKKTFTIRSGSEKIWTDELIKQFPKEEEAIRRFVAALKAANKSFYFAGVIKFLPYWLVKICLKVGIFNWISDYDKWNKTTVKQYINDLTDNKDLRLVLQYIFGDYGTIPEKASLAMLSLVHVHYWNGAFYPRGGSSEIPYHITKVIEKAGGAVLVRAKVTGVLLDESRMTVTGVRVQKGSQTHEIRAPIVVSGAGFANTFGELVPEDVRWRLEYHKDAKDLVTPSVSCFQAFIGFKGSSEELKLPKYNTWYYASHDDISTVTKRYMNQTREEAFDTDPPFVFIAFPSIKDSTYAQRHPGKSACTVITLGNYEWFKEWADGAATKRGDEYESIKKTIGQRILDIIQKLFPQIEDGIVEYVSYGTGVSNNYYLGTKQGELYGLDHDVDRFSLEAQAALRPETGIKGLYLTGQDVISAGFAGALSAGVVTASKILNRNLFDERTKYMRELRAKAGDVDKKRD